MKKCKKKKSTPGSADISDEVHGYLWALTFICNPCNGLSAQHTV